MARRHGRNQRRKATNEIAALREAVYMRDGLLRHTSGKLEDARETINEMVRTIESVCEHSVALPPKKVTGQHDIDRLTIGIKGRMDFALWGNGEIPTNQSFKTVDLYALRTYIKEHADTMSTAVHLIYEAGAHSAYMISKDALAAIPEDMMAKTVFRDIATKLVRHIKQGGGRR